MTVHCPRCATGYLLPEHLMGPAGARVKCPSCGESFAVRRDGRPAPPDDAPVPPPSPEPPRPSQVATPELAHGDPAMEAAQRDEGSVEEDPRQIAAELLDELEARLGPRLAEARARGRVLAVAGPDLMASYDAYQARLGGRASAEIFRRLVRERLGLSLERHGA